MKTTATEWNIFELTGPVPRSGAAFRADDQRPGAEPVVVLSDRTWRVPVRRRSRASWIGQPMSGVPTRVIGVMPAGYGSRSRPRLGADPPGTAGDGDPGRSSW